MAHDSLLTGYDITEVRENEGGYNYYLFCRGDNTWKILREKTDGTEYRYAVGAKNSLTNFTNRAMLIYKKPDELPKA